ncbi:hypothetical protein FQR65_LT15800 [Abscondita terminalis]|nr:hypothetical protein FQR65_LT15800 [Abscondita terminalis]
MEDVPVVSKQSADTDTGKHYEVKITALLALRCVQNPNVKYAWFASNINHAEDFDDVVLHLENENQFCTTYLIQLKHSNDPQPIPQKDFLYDPEVKKKSSMKKDFSVNHYHRGYLEVKKNLKLYLKTNDGLLTSLDKTNKTFYAIYTNRPLDKNKKYEFLDVYEGDPNLLDISTKKCIVYRFKPDVFKFDDEFLDTFLLFTQQANFTDMDELIKDELKRMTVSVNIDAVEINTLLKNYLGFVQTSIKGVKAETSTKTKPTKKPSSKSSTKTKSTGQSAEAPLENLTETKTQNKDVKFEAFTKTDLVGQLTSFLLNDYVVKFPLNFQKIKEFKSWDKFLDGKALVLVEDDEYARKFLNSYVSEKIAMHCLLDNWNQKLIKNTFYKKVPCLKSILTKMVGEGDLSVLTVYKALWLQKMVPFLGQIKTVQDFERVQAVLRLSDNGYSVILLSNANLPNTPGCLRDLNDLNSKHQEEILDHAITLQGRKVQRLGDVVDKSMYNLIKCKDIIDIISNQFNVGEAQGKESEFYMQRTLSEQKGLFDEHLCVIVADARMGKTEFLNDVALHAPNHLWIIKVTLKEHNDYYKTLKNSNNNALDHLNYFYGVSNSLKQELAQQVFVKFASEKKVLVLLDGFDEILMIYKDEVTSIVKSLHKSGYKVWVTTRPVTKNHLEEALATTSRFLKPLSIEDQRELLTRHYKHLAKNKGTEQMITTFVTKLVKSVAENLRDRSGEFTALPLETADVFKNDLKTVLETNNFWMNDLVCDDKFDVIYLYNTFLTEKNNLMYKKSGEILMEMKESFEEFQKLCALLYVFPEKLFSKMQVKKKWNLFYESLKHLLGRDGVVLIDGATLEITFSHRTFAEFLAAKWMYDNWKEEDLSALFKCRFDGELNFLFGVFDRYVAEKRLLDLSIISGCTDQALELVKSVSVSLLDGCGRTSLHLLACYTFSDIEVFNEIMKVLPQSMVGVKDGLLRYSAFEYAVYSKNISVVDRLCKNSTELPYSLELHTKDLLLQLSFSNHLNDLFFTLLKYFARKELLLKHATPSTTMEQYCSAQIKMYQTRYKWKTVFDFVKNVYCGDINFVVAFETADKLLPLMDDVIKLDNDSYTALHYASIHNNLQNALLLLSKFRNTIDLLNKDGETPLHLAITNQCLDVANLLLQEGADVNLPNIFGDTPLVYACKIGNTQLVETLLPSVSDINRRNMSGETVLHVALRNKHFEVARFLIDHRANVNVNNDFEENALMYATKFGEINFVNDILPMISEINAQNKNGDAALHLALRNEHFEIADVLIEEGADVNLINSLGENAFMYFCKFGDKKLVEKVLPMVANVNSENANGKTARDFALENQNVEVVQILIEAGAT